MAFQPRPMKDVLADVGKKVTVGRTSQEQVEAARRRGTGMDYVEDRRGRSPEFKAWAKQEIESRASRWVRGRYETKGRAPGFVLSESQFTEFQQTGQWSGDNPRMPTVEEYGPQHQVNEDKEYTPIR